MSARLFNIGFRVRSKHHQDYTGTVTGLAEEIRADGEYWYWVHWDDIGDPESGGVPEAESDLLNVDEEA